MAATPPMRVDLSPGGGGAGVARLRLHRPPANAFDLDAYSRLLAVLRQLATEPPRVLQLGSGVERFFSGGRDLREPSPATSGARAERQRTVTALYDALLHLPCPTIAVLDGYALGAGCVLASLCDIRIATERTVLGLPEVRAGSVGGARHLMRVLPHGVVRRMALTGEPLDAGRAAALGLVDVVPPGADPWVEADRIAGVLAQLDPVAVRRVKSALGAAEKHPLAAGFALELAIGGGGDAPDAG